MPRPLKLTPDVVKRFVNAMRLGAPFDLSCRYAQVHRATAYKWLKQAEADVAAGLDADASVYVQFAEAVELAEGEMLVANLAVLEKAAARDWKAAAWRLERRFPQQFGRKVDVQANFLHVILHVATGAGYKVGTTAGRWPPTWSRP
mgnify:CR=1 FL=1